MFNQPINADTSSVTMEQTGQGDPSPVIVVPVENIKEAALSFGGDLIDGAVILYPVLFPSNSGTISVTFVAPDGLIPTIDPAIDLGSASSKFYNELLKWNRLEGQSLFGIEDLSCALPQNIIVTISNKNVSPINVNTININGIDYYHVVIDLKSAIEFAERDKTESNRIVDLKLALNSTIEKAVRLLIFTNINTQNVGLDGQTCFRNIVMSRGISGEFFSGESSIRFMDDSEKNLDGLINSISAEILIAYKTVTSQNSSYSDFEKTVIETLGRAPYMDSGFYNVRMLSVYLDPATYLYPNSIEEVETLIHEDNGVQPAFLFLAGAIGIIAIGGGLALTRRRRVGSEILSRGDIDYGIGLISQAELEIDSILALMTEDDQYTVERIQTILSTVLTTRKSLTERNEKASLANWLVGTGQQASDYILPNLDGRFNPIRIAVTKTIEKIGLDLSNQESVEQYNTFISQLPEELQHALNLKPVEVIARSVEPMFNVLSENDELTINEMLGKIPLDPADNGLRKDVTAIIRTAQIGGFQAVLKMAEDPSYRKRFTVTGSKQMKVLVDGKLQVTSDSQGKLIFTKY